MAVLETCWIGDNVMKFTVPPYPENSKDVFRSRGYMPLKRFVMSADKPKNDLAQLIAKCPHSIVSMVVFEGKLLVATSEDVFQKIGDEFVEMRFVYQAK